MLKLSAWDLQVVYGSRTVLDISTVVMNEFLFPGCNSVVIIYWVLVCVDRNVNDTKWK